MTLGPAERVSSGLLSPLSMSAYVTDLDSMAHTYLLPWCFKFILLFCFAGYKFFG